MGCCISTNSGTPAVASKKHKHVGSDEASSKLKNGFSHESRALPPSPPPTCIDQEETVKEVLSETPKPKPKPKPDPIFTAHMKQDLQQQQQQEEKESKIGDSPHKVEAFAKNIQDKQNLSSSNEEEIMSQVSEICSASVSESLSTMTNVTDMRDIEEGEQEVRQRQRVVTRSPVKPLPRSRCKTDRVVSQSPTRRSDQSPGRRIGSGPSAQNHDPGRVKCPGRRSRSPATTTRSSAPPAVMGRSPSARRTNRSPGRARSVPIENTTDCATSSSISNSNNNNNNNHLGSSSSSGSRGGKWSSSHNNNNNDINNNNNDHCRSSNESLENPLVSLECFIFL